MARPLALSIFVIISLINFSSARFTSSHNYLHRRQSPPETLPEDWSYKGCYTDDVANRSLRSAASAGEDMTAEVCIAFCTSRGYKLAGTEYSVECFCGNTIMEPGVEATEGCNMPCAGAAGEACGGASRLSIYEKAITAGGGGGGPVVNPRVGEWGSLGCYVDSAAARTLSEIGIIDGGPSAMTVEACAASCEASEYKYAGVEYSGECFCGNTIDNDATPAASGCDMTCNGNSSQICGGSNRINLYEFGLQDPEPPVPTGWVAQGCYTDSVAQRTLQFGGVVAGAMTNGKCNAACEASGYIYAGTEYAGECYCDNQLRNGGGPAPDGDVGCNMACNGNTTDMCGGANRLNLFRLYGSSEPTETPTPTSMVPSETASETATQSNTATATATGLPDGFEYKGCWKDGPGFRIMNFQQADDAEMTISSCSNKCADAGYSIAGMEYSYQCFCDNVIRQGGSLANDDSECGMNCAGAADEKCGGPDRLSVWASGDITVVQPPKAQDEDLPGNWAYQGCITDPIDNRVFPWQIVDKTNNSATSCLSQCAEFGYMAAGMEYGEECYCGDLDGVEISGAEEVSETECQIACPGNPEGLCGGNNRLTWYKWEDDPLYVWHYPSGNAAGEYRFLVGGPVIPLITQPAINGKISLLEKKGTGPPNSTGAYEFDPSLSDDIFSTFREMQGIQTDIFCAAGLTMPDKAGRQINIGGWSLESTFGVRIYTPDGVLGTNGTNDWQESYDEIRLQAGRWYPTGMIMANGSMLIVGGQSGSNGPPVPNMEILPRVGPIKHADYLERTDPFNLYPFLVVLPSGGIFIQYYNEARILDEVTLDTIKILPDVPGSVNNPKAGRTYPYEGTQVLLPQHAPYSDPLEVLVCGGAAPNPTWGLDNCVSIAPDVAAPKWTIERMPSRRVISCMTTLPDGTFLILNGAETGEAGFGLADSPNYNAVLYDTSKPVHQRMSVMANTTIARMYHSEAVLMDDGRILVSGSDPQDPDWPQEYRLEVFIPPYRLSGAPIPTFTIADTDWANDGTYAFEITSATTGAIRVSLLGAESSTHGSSMGARILFPEIACAGGSCTVTAPPGPHVCPPGWYRMFVLDGPTPSHATWVRIGGDPGELGNWPNTPSFQPLPGM